MYKIDKIKHLFDCDLCHELLVDPITLVCGNNACKKHIDMPKETTSFKCGICHDEHLIPKRGFALNKRMQDGLEIQLNALKLVPAYDECKVEIQKANENVDKIESLRKNSEIYIYEYFEDIKRQVDIRRENLKNQIDKYSDEVIQLIEKSQLNYIQLSKEANVITANIDEYKESLDYFIYQFDTLDINDKKFENIKISISVLNNNFKDIISNYQKSLLSNNEYSFNINEMPIQSVFGSFKNLKEIKSSSKNRIYCCCPNSISCPNCGKRKK